MVEQIEGRGNHYRNLLQLHARDGFQFENIRFYFDKPDQMNIYNRMLAQIQSNPSLDKATWLFNDVTDTAGARILVLSGPRDKLSNPFRNNAEVEGLPPEGYCYVVISYRAEGTRTSLVIVDNPDSAIRIARRGLRDLGWHRNYFNSVAFLIEPDKFVELAKKEIDIGHSQADFTLRYAGLRQYQEEAFAKRKKLKK